MVDYPIKQCYKQAKSKVIRKYKICHLMDYITSTIYYYTITLLLPFCHVIWNQ